MMATDPAMLHTTAAVVVEPRYAKVMPWVLAAAAVALMIVAVVLRDGTRHDSVVLVQSRISSSAAAPPSSRQAANALPAEKKTTTDKALSDSVFTTMLGVAALLLALCAFYTRITKITVAGNTVELAGIPEASQQDSKAIAEEIRQWVTVEMKRAAGEKDAVPAEVAADIAERSAVAAGRAQLEAAWLRAAATATVREPVTVNVDAAELRALGTGMPLPPSLLKRLADQALHEAAKPPSDPES